MRDAITPRRRRSRTSRDRFWTRRRRARYPPRARSPRSPWWWKDARARWRKTRCWFPRSARWTPRFDPAARGAARGAARVLAELAEHAGHALTQLHADVVLPHVTNALRTAVDAESKLGADGESGEVEGFSAPTHAALASLCENFSNEELAPGVGALARTLVAGAACAGAPPGARARCLTTLAAVARAAAWDFEPYARETLDALAALADEGANDKGAHANANANANKEIRARALAAMATVVAAVGEDSAPPGVIGALLDAATRDASTVGDGETASTTRECALRCFGRLATTLETRASRRGSTSRRAPRYARSNATARAPSSAAGATVDRAVTTGNAGRRRRRRRRSAPS